MKIALAGIVRDEFPYLLEWIAYHKGIGIDHFIIANHSSIDGTTELLEAFQKLGLVTTFYIPKEEEAPQLPTYKKIIEDYGKDYDWLGFLDADEFFVPKEHASLKKILLEQENTTGGIIFHWAVYGSSFQKYPDDFELPSPVTSRFTWRAPKNFVANSLTKCFIKPEAVDKSLIIPVGDPHAIYLLDSFNYVNSEFNTIEGNPIQGGYSATWKSARINHYVIKSNWEFKNRKMPNGTVAWGNNIHRDWLFFQSHDKNDVFDPMPLLLQLMRDEQINCLKQKLSAIGYKYPVKKQNPSTIQEVILREINPVQIKGNSLIISGWVMDSNGKAVSTELDFYLKSGDFKIEPFLFKIKKNKKLKQEMLHSSVRCGFEIHFSLENFKGKDVISLIVYSENEEINILDINMQDLF